MIADTRTGLGAPIITAPSSCHQCAHPRLAAAGLALALCLAALLVADGALTLTSGDAAKLARYVSSTYAVVLTVAMAWRLWLWRSYRPTRTVAETDLPSICVVMPAFNEEKLIADSIRALSECDYPRELLEIVIVDDGSTDATWRQIRASVAMLPADLRVRTLRHPKNLGKRRALYAGFRTSAADVFVTLDSDSIITRDALRHLVAPLVRDEQVVCVAGCIEALQPRRSMISRFLKCYYSLSFKFTRAAQHQFRGIFCAPGALSAYRASAVRPVLDAWLGQRFLGAPCTTGEDRALTNLVLRRGGLTAYQQTAVVLSDVPVSYRGMVKMFLRWARSNIRETLVLWSFLWTPFRRRHLLAFRLNMVIVLLSLLLAPLLVAHGLALALARDGGLAWYLGGGLTLSAVLAAIYYANERDRDWPWLLCYHFFWVIGLSWIVPYAAVTLRNTGWLTRGARQTGAASATANLRPAGSRRPLAAT